MLEAVPIVEEYKDDYIIFGCNDSYKVIPWLDEHYACDDRWWRFNGPDFRKRCPNLSSWTQSKEGAKSWNIQLVQGYHRDLMSIDSSYIHFGSNSGFQMLNIAFLMGCSKFILVGYDMQHINKKTHFFGDHPGGMSNSSPYGKFINYYSKIQPEIRELIVNCSPNSALTVFRKNTLREELENNKSFKTNS